MLNRFYRKDSLSTSRFSPLIIAAWLVVLISFFTRLFLLLKTGKQVDFSATNLAGIFLVGLLFDLAMCAYLLLPLTLLIWFTNDRIYQPKWKRIIAGIGAVGIGIYFFTDIVPADFNKELKKGVGFYLLARLVIFLFLMFKDKAFRQKWRVGVLYFDFFLLTFLLLFNAVSEWFFWDEFSVRYNFIAVDYLVYTNEVLGNIRESYPIPLIITGLLVATLFVFGAIKNNLRKSVYSFADFKVRTITALVIIGLCALTHFFVKEDWRHFSKSEYANELAGNGVYQFGNAFWHNELDFYKFYKTLPDSEAFAIVKKDLAAPYSTFVSTDPFNLDRSVSYAEPEIKRNVVLISVESYSADFMKAFGNTKNITPHLDSLAGVSLFFKNMYASGTRTVRGLEALSLGLPPSSGQSIVKRPDNENLFSLGSVFRSKGYSTQYIYGGYSYFDNMKHFFGNNDYDVIDRDSLKKEDIHYQNIWGVADEDLFTLAGRTLDKNYAIGKPFYTQIMTVSNHRPFTYPSGRIDIDPASQSREGGVKYTDYAINRFLKESAVKPWYRNTIFVIVADHCAGSAGNVQLPVTGYHIPCLIFAPGIVSPGVVDRLTAQIDLPPTILGLLNFNYTSRFFGQDILHLPAGNDKAFISTYQGLGFIHQNKLIIQSPVRKVVQLKPNFITGSAIAEQPDTVLVKKAIAYYQVSSWLIKHRRYNKIQH